MRSRAVLAASVGVVVLAIAGCDGSSDDDSRPEEPSTTTESAAAATTAEGFPEVGTCWAVPTARVADSTYLFDDSDPVPCTEPHTAETVWVWRLDEPTADAARYQSEACSHLVVRYLSIDEDSWIPWGHRVFLPSEKEVAEGAAYLRCDAVFPRTWGWRTARRVTVAAAELADANSVPNDHWACLDEPPTTFDQPFVPCDRPHAYEETGTLAVLRSADRYPRPSRLAAAARRQCRATVPDGYDDVSVTATWDSRAGFVRSSPIVGVCFMFNADGRPLPAR